MDGKIQSITRYIELTRLDEAADRAYQLSARDLLALYGAADRDTGRALCLAFFFGRAKGWRAAKAQ